MFCESTLTGFQNILIIGFSCNLNTKNRFSTELFAISESVRCTLSGTVCPRNRTRDLRSISGHDPRYHHFASQQHLQRHYAISSYVNVREVYPWATLLPTVLTKLFLFLHLLITFTYFHFILVFTIK